MINLKSFKESSSLETLAYQAIREAITSGKIVPGSWIRQVELANELGVSQRTVREGLNRLSSEGLVIKEPYKGYRCCMLNLNTQKELYDIRALLEGLAMEYAAVSISDADLAHLRAILPLTVAGEEPESVEIARDKNREFHWIAIRSSGHIHLERLLEQTWDLILTYFQVDRDPATARIGGGKGDLKDHQMLLNALENHDSVKAKEIAIKPCSWNPVNAATSFKG